ncbi:unnamed protein product [Caenorhabditis angaria]|uniref:Potassium channel domain-containing protein n=1 Tax=Caenorhabditis angaria TaxID=860376 RepID=A0A9P1MYV1_9PELO|nr:unnamed protein product [Caenorhabditis angaria]
MEEQLKEIEGLLETTTRSDDGETTTPLDNIKKYIKLAFPHVALVAVVCLYATIGAFIFYRLESQNEIDLKTAGKVNITILRTRLINLIRDGDVYNHTWKDNVEIRLTNYTEQLYKSFKEHYVRFSDVKNIGDDSKNSEEHEIDSDRKRRHRHGGKGRGNQDGEKMWTKSSALFFAATTMATIGYGNIVPATTQGRIACVIFALFGAPLAIITIGDLGKFLSECTIWLYKQMRKSGNDFKDFIRRIRGIEISETGTDIENARKNSQDPEGSSELDWEDLVIDKTEVPVMMVFTILLLYIAFGGVLFSFIEGWSYMDAFYYSFISLTTIGFGDIVPENHDYILIMLIYLGVGLSVTTMCIDLVGIQYIQKIHYFGRKFRGTDLLHLLKRKRMIERRLAMGQGEDILRMYVQQIEKEVVEQIQQQQQLQVEEEEIPSPEEKSINNSLMRIDDSLSEFQIRFYDTYDEEDLKSPTCHSIRSFQPSIWTQSSARSYVYSQFQRQRGDSWDESGPSLSEHCSLSTEPSVHIRQAYWDNYSSPTPSVISFLHRHLYSPSVASTISFDYENIASTSKQAARPSSCPPVPGKIPLPRFTDSVSPARPNSSDRQRHQEHVSTASEPIYSMSPLSFRLPEPFMLSNLAAICDDFDAGSDCLNLASKNMHDSKLSADLHVNREDYKNEEKTTTSSTPLIETNQQQHFQSPPHIPKLRLSPKRLSVIDENKSEMQLASPEPVLKRKNRERVARQQHPLHSFDWLNVSPRQFRPEICISEDLPKLFKLVRNPDSTATTTTESDSETPESVVLISPRSPIGLACMQDWDSYIQMLEEASKNFQFPIEDEIEEEDEEEIERESIPHEIVKSSSEVFSSITIDSSTYQLHFAPLIFYQRAASVLTEECPMGNNYNSPPNLDSVSCDDFEMLPSPIPLEVQSSESEDEPIGVEVKEDRLKAMNEIDLGAFELVDSGLTPEALLAKDEPVIFHQRMPVHSVHHDTVQTEAALANLMSAPSSMLTDGIPPIMVEDNYCFVVDGERVRMGDILGDDQWWRHTSRPTKYFYSEDLRQFHRVNCITAKGKVITAKLATQLTHQPSTSSMSTSMSQSTSLSSSSHAPIHPQHHSMSNTPRSSISGGTQQTTPNRSSHHDANKVPLNNVYKVIRFYSFWKTCTSFHRIVTMIDKVVDEPSTTSEGGNTFKKRLFVQYLWRNAKAVEKARVQKEFDPRRQRLLRFVTDPAARKRFVEDEYFAVIVDDNGNESESENDEDDDENDEESKNNRDPQKLRRNQKIQVIMHPGKGGNVPIYSNDEEHPLDGPHTILHAVQCPKQFVAKIAPNDVTDTCCFVLDSSLVTMQMIEEDADNIRWKQTMSTTHYYATDNWNDDFYRVTPLMCRGVLRGAYRIGKDKSRRIQKVEIFKVYRVTRHFSCWKTVPRFHRVLSLVEAAIPYEKLTIKQKQLVKANGKKLINRLFIQYYWRNQQIPSLRDQIIAEYAESSKKCRAKKSWIRVVKNVQRMKEAADLLKINNKKN